MHICIIIGIQMKRPIQEVVADLRQYIKSTGCTQSDLSAETGIHQSQLSRILGGEARRLSKNLMALCKYANISVEMKDPQPEANPDLMQALRETWNGSERHAQQLAMLIRKAGPILYR